LEHPSSNQPAGRYDEGRRWGQPRRIAADESAHALRSRSRSGARAARSRAAAAATSRERAGTPPAHDRGMAAVFALVFLFALASILLFVKSLGAVTFGTALAAGLFIALASGVFLALYRMAKQWEGSHHDGQ
jgi:hypothetical protein